MKPPKPLLGFGPTFPKPGARPNRGRASERVVLPAEPSEPTPASHFGPSMVAHWVPTGVEGRFEVGLPQNVRLCVRWRELRGALEVGAVGSFELEGRTLSHAETLVETRVRDDGGQTRLYRAGGLVEVCVTELCAAVQQGGVVVARAEPDGSFVFWAEGARGRLDATGSHVFIERRSYADASS